MGKGKLIIIESGSDASGKATQSQRLYERLIQEGKKCLKITFPDYDSDSSALVKMYLNGDFGKILVLSISYFINFLCCR